MRQTIKSLLAMTSKTSPSVPSASVNPTARASSLDGELGRRPMTTLVSMPASASESRRFCAWAGACEPHPMTPICLMPLKASGRSLYLSRPPLQQCAAMLLRLWRVVGMQTKGCEEKRAGC
jgi:hypothetical protein